MHYQKSNQYQNNTQKYLSQNNPYRTYRTKRYKREIPYSTANNSYRNIAPSPEMYDYDRHLEISNDESNPQTMHKSRSIIRSIRDNIDEKYTPSQLVGDKPLSSALRNFSSRFEEREPSPKTINIGDTKESIEYNIRTLNARKSPRYYEEFYPQQEMNYLESNESEPRNGSFDGRKYYGQNNIGYMERGRNNIIVNRYNIDNNASMNLMDRNSEMIVSGNIYNVPQGGRIALRGQVSPYQNFDEMNTSNEYERGGSEDRKNRSYVGNTSYDYRQNRFRNANMVQNQPMYMNNMNTISTINNMNNYNNMNSYNQLTNSINNQNVNLTQDQINTITMPRDNIQEKYINKTYDNMTYKDVKKIVRRFTKVYDPNKNNNGLLVEESQVTVPGANDDVFNNRYRVLTKMNRLSNILLAKQRRGSPPRPEEDFLYVNSDEMSAEHSDEYNIRTNKSFNRQNFIRRKSPIKMPNRKSPENKFKYVSLAILSSKGLRTEDRVILRKMRFEKGGVVDLAQEEKRRGKYKIRKVSRSPGYKRNFYRTNPRYREQAAIYIQNWWKEMKELMKKRIKKIIKIQSVYRGRFVRKYLYDLLYLNYLYLSFCQKIEKVLKQEIKPYIFNILKNYRKRKFSSEEEKDYDILKNIVASKSKKWKILNLRKCIDKWKRFFRNKEKLTLLIYKILKLRVENQNKNNILRDALRKWNYITKTIKMLEEFEEEKKIIIEKNVVKEIVYEKDDKKDEEENLRRINKAKEEHNNKIKGLFKLLDGINRYSKKSALEPTLPKLIYYLSNEYLYKLLRKIINQKEIDEKEKLKNYFYKYIKMTLKCIKNKINEPEKPKPKEEPITKKEAEPKPEEPKEETTTTTIKRTKVERKVIVRNIPEKQIHEPTKEHQIEILGEPPKVVEQEPKVIEREPEPVKEKEINKDEILKMKARIFLHMVNCVKNKQNKNILRKYFTKYFKKVVQLQREEDRKNFEEQQKRENLKRDKERKEEKLREAQREKEREIEKEKDKQREKERQIEREKEIQREKERKIEREKDKQREKDINDDKVKNDNMQKEIEEEKKEIIKYKEIIEKYKIIINKQKEEPTPTSTVNEEELYLKFNQQLIDKIKACEILRRYVLRNTHKYPLEAFGDKLYEPRKKYLLIKILKIKNNLKKKLLKKYFDKWRNQIFDKYKKDSQRKLFVKIITIIKDNYTKRILRKKLNQWKNNSKPKEEPKEIIIEKEPEKEQPTIFDTLKKVKDIINFNDYLRNITVNKYGKTFFDKLNKTRNPALKNKYIKKIVRRKILDNKSALRRAFYKWKNNVDVENALKVLKTKLIFTLYGKNENINQNNVLQKWFNKWKNLTILDKIKKNINILKQIQNETKIIMLKTIIRNKNRNLKKDTLKKYFNKWKNVVKGDIPRLNDLFKKITKINTLKNGPELLDKLDKVRNINRKKDILLKAIPIRKKNEKLLLYKYLLRWRNKVYGINSNDMSIIYGKKMLSILLNKNDKQNILKAFNKWRYGKNEKIPVNAYKAALRKIKTTICKEPFRKFVDKLDKTNPKKLRPKAMKIETIIEKITKEKPFVKLIKNMRTIIRVNQLKKIQPKVHDITRKYYLQKYLDRWRYNTKEQRLKNMKVITKWLKKKYDIEKERRKKRRSELLKRIIGNLVKEDKHKMQFPLHFWKRITNIYTDNDNARIIQNFCRKILLKIQKKKLDDQKKLTNLIIKLYKKTIIKTVTDKKDVGEVNKYINTKNENNRRLKDIINHRDKNNNRILLRLAMLKWNSGKEKYDKSIEIIQKKIRQIISKNKLNDKRLLQNILKHIVKSNENKNKNILRNKLLQWYAIAKKLNYHDTSKIEEFIRKIVVGRLQRKLQTILDKYTNKYFIYLLTNIAKINKLKNTLRKEPTRDAFNKIKSYIRKKDIKDILNNLVNNKDDKLRILLIKKYFNKWNNKVKDINDKENKAIILIQKYFRGKRVKSDIDKERKIKKILTEIIIRYGENSPLNLYFAKWKRITRRIICDENARIIQNFCRTIHDKFIKMKKDKDDENYKNLAQKLVKIGRIPRKIVLDKLKTINRNDKLTKLVNILDKKRKDTLKDAFDNIRNNNKLVVLRNNLDIKNNQRKRILKKYLIRWRNKALSSKYIIYYLTKFLKNNEDTNNNLLRSTLYRWLYKTRFIIVKENERIISEFCKEISRKIYITKKWKELADKLRKKEKGKDIDDINKKLRTYIILKIITKTVKNHAIKDVSDTLRKKRDVVEFKERIEVILDKVDNDVNEISIKKYFDIWRNNTQKIRNRMNKLDELMKMLSVKQIRDNANTYYQVILLKKLFNDLPKFFLINAFRRIKDFADKKTNNERLAVDLLRTKNDIEPKKKSPFVKKLIRVYAYKVLDKLFNNIQNGIRRKNEPLKYIFLEKMIKYYTDRNKDYTYSNQIQNENKPYTKKIAFKTKKKTQPKTLQDKSQIYSPLTSILVKLIDDLINKRKKDAFNNIKKRFIDEKFISAIEKYVHKKELPNFLDFIERLKVLFDMYENEGPKKAKLFKLLRRIIIKKLFIQKEEIYRENRLFYLVNLTMFNLEMAKSRWIRQIIRKWKFITFMKIMAKKKMELMYKNLHVSYLEMVNSIFSDEEKINPSVVKEFERFGYGVGMFVNEDPYNPQEVKMCSGVKKLYNFPIKMEKVIETKKKIVEKEIKEEQYVTGIEGGQYGGMEYETESGKRYMGSMDMSGRAEFDYDNKESKDEDSGLRKEDSKEGKSSKIKGRRLKAHYSTRPLDEKDDQKEEDEKEENM